ncbi:TonB-dependent receptor domain-containing protein [Sandaracinobacteroides hominis]|uniref:TonB-dependent receptor domain-containing protein n=1 Tax=Sandaracinobacteroides hominis TaxID=2780086 RepID=UPI0018F64BD4|nr:TonB-dependent receptor [Sandaracinobacteroides hominis]
MRGGNTYGMKAGIVGRSAAIASVLLATSALVMTCAATPALAQSAGTHAFDIPAQPLQDAIVLFNKQSGIQITAEGGLIAGRSSAAVKGDQPAARALSTLLAGSGLTYRWVDSRSVALEPAPQAANDVVLLGSLRVEGAAGANGGGAFAGNASEAPFFTPGATNYISGKQIERFRGSSPADILRGTPGVMSGEARNSGALDVNIRGMQGMGRVAVSVDGAENAMSIYQGYQGMSNRTFVDPDLIAGIDITKGSDMASRGIAGTVSMRTLGADDIVEPGETWGLRVKAGFGTNTSKPVADARGGYAWPNSPYAPGVATPSPDGMDRPGLFTPTSGSGSIVVAAKQDGYDVLAGYAYRKQGNYHAGNKGPAASPINTGPREICSTPTYCQTWSNYVENQGLTNYRAGEEVLNTELETHSWLLKTVFSLGEGHSLQFGYTGYRGKAGDRLASGLTNARAQPIQQTRPADTKLDTGTIRYAWNPDDDDLVDLKANLWAADLRLRNLPRNAYGVRPENIGLKKGYLTGSDTVMWGVDVSNTSAFALKDAGALSASYGLSWMTEDTRPSAYTDVIEGWLNVRDARREEIAAFAKLSYTPLEWLAVNGGLRYAHYWSEDRRTDANSKEQLSKKPFQNEGGFSPSIGLTIDPAEGVQLYGNYSSTLRFPALVETSSTFTMIPNPDIKPERSRNLEAGANLRKSGLFAEGDSAMLKLGYFNWNVKNYISREYRAFVERPDFTWTGMQIFNIDRARFTGLELSGRYENKGFTAELGGNYYLDMEFCREAGVCASKTLYSDYATNHVPPEYMIDLTLTQKLLADKLDIGGRIIHNGPRAIGHGQVTAEGMSQFISLVKWKPYTLVDVFAEYKLNSNLTAALRAENLFDQYYVDPLGLVNQPGPGRTIYMSLTGQFGGKPSSSQATPLRESAWRGGDMDWTGLYGGFHGGLSWASMRGTTTLLDGKPDPVAASESANANLGPAPLFGGQLGFNYQFDNRIVIGVEGDYSKSWLKATQDTLTRAELVQPQNEGVGFAHASTHYEVDSISTLRGRVGYSLTNGMLAYGSVGVAFLKERQARDQRRYVNDYYDGESTELMFVEKATMNRTGVAFALGMEHAINDRWSVKTEYSYGRFGKRDFTFADARAGSGTSYTVVTQEGTRIDPPVFAPDDPICELPGMGVFCSEREVPNMVSTNHTGSSEIVNGRHARNSADTHGLRIGFNYRF